MHEETTMTPSGRAVRWLAVGLLAALAVGSGCGTAPRGQVEGKVLLDGREATAGLVQFLGADGQTVSAEIRGGTYQVSDVAVGEASDIAIPERYARPESSGLKYLVEAGPHTHNIELQTRP
jgi:hypothetical protein